MNRDFDVIAEDGGPSGEHRNLRVIMNDREQDRS
jgi:hypothetical protein